MSKIILFFKDFGQFLVHEKRWWLIPVFVVLGLLCTLIVLTEGSAMLPLVYTLF